IAQRLVQLPGDGQAADTGEEVAGNRFRREEGADLEELVGGRAAGFQLVEGNVPGGGDRDLVTGRGGRVQDFGDLFVEKAEIFADGHAGFRAPRGGLLDGEG